jgi:hypothetical protein
MRISLLALLLLGDAVGPASARDKPRQACCFNNPRHAGGCSVEPAAGESCASVLRYLNDPKAAGKTYCSSTTIRGGWKAVRCKPERD